MRESTIPLVENPRGRRRRRLTAKQKKAGFGGRAAMTRSRGGRRRRRAVRRTTRRRNPYVMTLGNPRRRRRRAAPRRSYGTRGLFGMIDLPSVMYVAGGAIGYGIVPDIIGRFFPQLPQTGLMGYGVKVGSAVALGWLAKLVTNSNKRAQQVVTGAMAVFLLDLYRTELAPRLGLGGFIGRPWAVPGDALRGYRGRAWAVPGDRGGSSRMFAGRALDMTLAG